jgi:hypothetical protein
MQNSGVAPNTDKPARRHEHNDDYAVPITQNFFILFKIMVEFCKNI